MSTAQHTTDAVGITASTPLTPAPKTRLRAAKPTWQPCNAMTQTLPRRRRRSRRGNVALLQGGRRCVRRWGRLVRRNIGAAGASAGAATRVHQARTDHYQKKPYRQCAGVLRRWGACSCAHRRACISFAGARARLRVRARADSCARTRVSISRAAHVAVQPVAAAAPRRPLRLGWVLSVPRILLQVLTKSVTVAIALPIQVPGRDSRMPWHSPRRRCPGQLHQAYQAVGR
jgi:hypothetical protein